MFLLTLIFLPLLGIFLVSFISTFNIQIGKTNNLKIIALAVTIVNLLVSLIMWLFILYFGLTYLLWEAFLASHKKSLITRAVLSVWDT